MDVPQEEFSRKTNAVLGHSWSVSTDFSILSYYNDGFRTLVTGISLHDSIGRLLMLNQIVCTTNGSILREVAYWTTNWNFVTPREWEEHATTNRFTINLERRPGENSLKFRILSPNGYTEEYKTSEIPEDILNSITHAGIRVLKGKVEFSNFVVETPLPPSLAVAMYPGLKINGEPGLNYSVQFKQAADENNWTTITNITLAKPAEYWFDLGWTNNVRRFYRAIQNAP